MRKRARYARMRTADRGYVQMKTVARPSLVTRLTKYDYDKIVRTSERGLAERVYIGGLTPDGVSSAIHQALRARGYKPHTRRVHGPFLLVWVERQQPALRVVKRGGDAA